MFSFNSFWRKQTPFPTKSEQREKQSLAKRVSRGVRQLCLLEGALRKQADGQLRWPRRAEGRLEAKRG